MPKPALSSRLFRFLLTGIVCIGLAASAVAESGDSGSQPPSERETAPGTSHPNPFRVQEYPGALSGKAIDQIRSDVSRLLDDSTLPKSSVGIFAVDIGSGQILYDHRSRQKMVPASNAKLVTSATVLDVFGPSHTFKTELFAGESVRDGNGDRRQAKGQQTRNSGTLRLDDGMLDGHLYVRGGGEPFLLFEDLVEWAAELRLKGLRTVDGDLVIDDSAFAGQYLPPGFDIKDEDDAYRAPIGPFSVNFNSVTVTIRPADEVGRRPEIQVRPPNSYVEVVNEAKTYPGSSGYFDISSEPMTSGKPGDRMAGGPRTRITIDGSIGKRAEPWASRVRIDHPPAFAASVFREALSLVDIQVTGEIRRGEVPDRLEPVLIHDSRPLTSIVSAMNKWSNNFMAEQLLRTLGTTRDGPATWAQSRTVVEAFMSRAGIPPGRYTLQNGSGLYEGSQIPPRAIVRLLVHMWEHRSSVEYIGSLAVAGRDGTLAERMTDTAAADNVRAKTGTLERVSALSGYLQSESGRPIAFSVLLNNTPRKAWRYRDLQDAIVTRLAEIKR